jgi:hypothetical protein
MSESIFDPPGLPPDEESVTAGESEEEWQSEVASEDKQEPEDDLHQLRALPGASPISDEAYGRISAARSTSEFELTESLSRYWERFLPDSIDVEEQLLLHDPSEIIPLFETYVRQQLDAHSQELVPLFSNGDTLSMRLEWDVLYMILGHIKPGQDSMNFGVLGPAKAINHFKASSEPWAAIALKRYITEGQGLWEVGVTASFERHLAKNNVERSRFPGPESTFALRYRYYLRDRSVWERFKNRVRAILYERILYWRAVANHRYAGLPPLEIGPAVLVGARSSHHVPETTTANNRDTPCSATGRPSSVDEGNGDERFLEVAVESAVPGHNETDGPETISSDPASEKTRRMELVSRFKRKGLESGIRIRDEMLAKAASPTWNDRTPITRWKADSRKSSPADDRLIRKLLSRDPSTIWPAS